MAVLLYVVQYPTCRGGQNKGQARGLMSQGSRFLGALVRRKIFAHAKKYEAALEGSPTNITDSQLVCAHVATWRASGNTRTHTDILVGWGLACRTPCGFHRPYSRLARPSLDGSYKEVAENSKPRPTKNQDTAKFSKASLETIFFQDLRTVTFIVRD